MRISHRAAAASGWILAAVFLLAAPAAGFEVETLPNGLTVVVDRVPGAPGVACIVAVGAGSADDTPHAGIAHYFEHMAFKGSSLYGPTEAHGAIESRGGEFNAFTAQDYTSYWIEIPRAHLATALSVLAEATLRPTFPEEEMERERSVILEEVRRRADDPNVRRWDRLGAVAFSAHTYGVPGAGDETSVRAITRADMRAFHEALYAPRNMILVVSGDVDPRAVVAEARRHFLAGDRAVAERRRPAEPPWPAPRTVVETARTARAYWALAALGPPASDARANAALDVAATVLAGGDASPLRRRLVDDLRAADGVAAWWSTSRDSDLFIVLGEAEPVDLPLVEREVRRALARLAVAAPDAEAVDRAKTRIEASWAFENEAPRARAQRLAFFWAEQELDEARRYLDRIRAVAPEDVRRSVAALRPDRALFFVLSPGGASGADAAAETALVLPNGMRLLLRPDSASGVVALVLGVAGGQTAEETPGAASLLAALLARGAAGRTPEEMAEAWEGAGLSVGAQSDPDLLAVTAAGPAEAAGLALRALGDVALAPDLPTDEVEAARERTLRALAARRDDPFNFGFERLKALALPGAYARPEEGDETSVRSLTRDDLASLHRRLFVPERMTLAVEGCFDPTAVAAAVRERFGALPAGAAAAPPAPGGPIPEETSETLERPGAEQGLLFVAVRAPRAGTADYATWKVLNAMLGGASQSRLFRHVREESGLAYEIGSFYPTRRGASLLVAYLGTDPVRLAPDAPPLEEAVRMALRRLRNEADDAELEAARAKVLGDFLLDHQTAGRRAWYRAWFEAVGLSAAYDDRYPAEIRAVTLEDVRAAADRVLTAPRVVLRVVPPR